ncbi:MAG: hypothetical protein HQK49_07970 [Oligoflexia bacterium]|nr:hypothetical protein [Oligoflexia bacterium]
MNDSEQSKNNLNKTVRIITQMGLNMASVLFSKLIKTDANIYIDKIYNEDISIVGNDIETNNKEVIAAMVDLVGDAPMKFLFMVPLDDALKITDLILGKKLGTTKNFDIYVESSVQEIGNIMASAISNVFVTTCKIKLLPSPPVVVKNYSSIIFQEYTFDLATESNEILIVESHFDLSATGINCILFLLPCLESKKVLSSIEGL